MKKKPGNNVRLFLYALRRKPFAFRLFHFT